MKVKTESAFDFRFLEENAKSVWDETDGWHYFTHRCLADPDMEWLKQIVWC